MSYEPLTGTRKHDLLVHGQIWKTNPPSHRICPSNPACQAFWHRAMGTPRHTGHPFVSAPLVRCAESMQWHHESDTGEDCTGLSRSVETNCHEMSNAACAHVSCGDTALGDKTKDDQRTLNHWALRLGSVSRAR